MPINWGSICRDLIFVAVCCECPCCRSKIFWFLKGLKRDPQPKSLVYGEKCKVQCTLILSKGHNGGCEQESDTNDTESAARGCVWLWLPLLDGKWLHCYLHSVFLIFRNSEETVLLPQWYIVFHYITVIYHAVFILEIRYCEKEITATVICHGR